MTRLIRPMTRSGHGQQLAICTKMSLVNAQQGRRAGIMRMADDIDYTKKLFLRLQSNGDIALDEEYLWDGCDTPDIDPEIVLTPVAFKTLARLLCDLYLDQPEQADIERLTVTLKEVEAGRDILQTTLQTIKAKFP